MSQGLLKAFETAASKGRALFIPYVVAGFPFLDNMHEQLLALEEKGAGIIELGVPFSDAVADGTVIQDASSLALSRSAVTIDDTFRVVKTAREKGLKVPVVLMTYYNLVFSYGHGKIIDGCVLSGVNGLIIVDLPLDHAGDLYSKSVEAGISLVPLVTLTSTDKRLDKILGLATSFIYVVSQLGVTGSAYDPNNQELRDLIKRLKEKTNLPLAVGFGVRSKKTFESLSTIAQGVVVGSHLVSSLNSVKDRKDQVTAKLKSAVDEILPVRVNDTAENASLDVKLFCDINSPTSSVIVHHDTPSAYFGDYGGRFVPEIFWKCLEELEVGLSQAMTDPEFLNELKEGRDYTGRESKLYFAQRLTKFAKGANIYLKREDLNHTGSHKINNAYGQVLLAKRLNKRRVIAETGAGQHGVATATACAKFGIECEIYMGEVDTVRQRSNVLKMELLGAKVNPVKTGTRTLKDAVNEALRDWSKNVNTTHYVIGSAVGPHPFPILVRELQSVIGSEVRSEFLRRFNKLPDALVACVGGGSNAIGLFYPFIDDESVRMFGVEAGGLKGSLCKHSATLTLGRDGVLHGSRTIILQDSQGQISETHSICAGLDYPGVGPEHAHLKSLGRVEYVSVNDDEALAAFKILTRLEGIIPALESSHAVHYALRLARNLGPGKDVVICLSGRGDKDLDIVTSEPYLSAMISSDLPDVSQ